MNLNDLKFSSNAIPCVVMSLDGNLVIWLPARISLIDDVDEE